MNKNKKIFITIVSFLAILTSCTSVSYIGTQSHVNQKQPKIVLWYQIAGLSHEHLPLVKFEQAQQAFSKSFEKFQCVGNIWSYNFYDIRPSIKSRFASQLSGNPDVNGSCDDLKNGFLWNYGDQIGYKTYILENENNDDFSFRSYLSCPTNQKSNLALISMKKSTGSAEDFHYQEAKRLIANGVSFDKSCNGQSCFSGWQNNLKSIVERVMNSNERAFVIFQDSSFYNSLKNQKILAAKDILIEISNHLKWAQELDSSEVLILVTGTNSLPIEYPNKGQEWIEYLKTGKNITYKKESLVSPIFAYGPSSENFCGVYSEEDVLKRMFWSPDEGFFSLKKFKSLFN